MQARKSAVNRPRLLLSFLALGVLCFGSNAFCDSVATVAPLATAPRVHTKAFSDHPKEHSGQHVRSYKGIPRPVVTTPFKVSLIEGQGTIRQFGDKTIIKIATPNAILEGNLSTDANDIVKIFMLSPSDSALLRSTTGLATDANGFYWSNANLFMVNTAGFVFAPSARVRAANILVSTLNISNSDFLSGCATGQYKFAGQGTYIINQGSLIPQPGGYVCLFSQAIRNEGTIEARLGNVAVAAGEKITLKTVDLDDQGTIFVAIDKAVESEVLGPDGTKLNSAIENKGTISADGGKVLLTTKVLNKIFDHAINNSGIIEAKTLTIGKDGEVKLAAEGAPVINTGTITAGKVKIRVKNANFTNQGKIVSESKNVSIKVKNATFINRGSVIAKAPVVVPPVTIAIAPAPAIGSVKISATDIIQDGVIFADNLVSIRAENSVSTTLPIIEDTAKSTVNQGPYSADGSPIAIISGGQVSITAKQIGSYNYAIKILSPSTAIYRTTGDIDISESLGIGTSILFRGPPEGGFAIICSTGTDLTLAASEGFIDVRKGVRLTAQNLTLQSQRGIYSAGSITTPNILRLTSAGDIYSLGVLESSRLIERGNTFQVGGVFHPGQADLKNADNAVEYSADTHLSAQITDPANVVVDAGITLTLDADTSFSAGNAFLMDPTSTISGGGYNLAISASNDSSLGNINNVNLLTLSSGSGSNVTFTSNSGSTFKVITVKTNHFAILSRSSGTGTSANPIMVYAVSNAPGGLQYVATSGLGLHYKLANNIDASETSQWNSGAGFVPIGDSAAAFIGYFDGNSLTVSNLMVNVTSGNPAGLFGYIASAGTIANMHLADASITGTTNVGGLVGISNLGTVNNSSSSGTVTGGIGVGGLVGWNGGFVNQSYSAAGVIGGGDDVGGLAGWNNCSIDSSYSTGNVSVTVNISASGSENVGGLVGYNYGGTITNSYSTGNVIENEAGSSNNALNIYNYVGGLAGRNDNIIDRSYSTGNVTGNIIIGGRGFFMITNDVGGLVGLNHGQIFNSFTTSIVSGSIYVSGSWIHYYFG
ncbi:MAG: hypothetical protein HQK55_07885, partial [Deltaproteobacteria bacterium]|nr:hypothetical protein [Deltaproteobacteria bacterium]